MGIPLIPNLSTTPTFASDWWFVVAKGNSNNAQRVQATLVAEFIQEYLSVGAATVYYSAPSATGFTTTIPDTSDNYRLILTPAAGYANGTIVLPSATAAVDQQTIVVNCTQAVTTLAITSSGGTVTGAPTTLAANAFFTLMFDAVTSTWYRCG